VNRGNSHQRSRKSRLENVSLQGIAYTAQGKEDGASVAVESKRSV
jgi:hypothetical protein